MAIAAASLLNFAGALISIAWNLVTWYLGLPSSSSHALIGGVVGSAVAADGFHVVIAEVPLGKVLIPAIVAPLLAFVAAGISIGLAYRVIGKQRRGPSAAAASTGRSSPAGCWRWRTAPTTRRRRAAIWGVARFVDLSQEERPVAAGVAALALSAAAAVVIGVVVMTGK